MDNDREWYTALAASRTQKMKARGREFTYLRHRLAETRGGNGVEVRIDAR